MKHPLINRTSPKGGPFLGTCAACGATNLSLGDPSECPNQRGMTQEEALIEAIEADPTQSSIPWPDPTPEMLQRPDFNAIWNVIKTWDINVPYAYGGYCGATGNHVRAILDALPLATVLPKGANS
jgi:hypothetical protein